MKKISLEILFINIKEITKNVFEKEIKKMNKESQKKVYSFHFLKDKKLQLASEILKQLNNKNFFSVSHSGDFCCIVFSDTEVGLDIQDKTQNLIWKSIAKRGFEECLIKNEDDFYKYWTAKESVIKCWGYENLLTITDIKISNHMAFAFKKQFNFINFNFAKNYIGAVCSAQKIKSVLVKKISMH